MNKRSNEFDEASFYSQILFFFFGIPFKLGRVSSLVLVACFCLAEKHAEGEEETEFAEIRECLRAADFDGAQNAFRKELRHHFDNEQLKKGYEELKTVLRLRENLKIEENAIRWSNLAGRLREYYRRHEIHSELIALSREVYRRSKADANAARVVEAYIIAGKYQSALDFVNSLEKADSNPVIQIEKACIFLAAGEKEKARKHARTIQADSMNAPEDLLRLARLQASTQLHATSVKTLVRCFERTPPNILARVKKEAAECPEFEPLLSSSEFTAAMATQSMISRDDPACSRKWIGLTIDERPWYIRAASNREINYDDWRISQ